ncbi:MAG: amidohydrolase [Gemmatimonadota bacterium]
MRRTISNRLAAVLTLVGIAAAPVVGQGVQPAPARPAGEGAGPFDRLVIAGVHLIDGTGAPMQGPVDILIEQNRIVEIRSAGTPGLPRTRSVPEGGHVIDAAGMYVLPGFVDLHAHSGGGQQGTPAEYVYKLWLARGVTTVRDPGSGNGVDRTLSERERSARNEITAPRVFTYVRPGAGWDGGAIDTPETAREYVRWAKQKGVDGFKLGSHDPDIMEALLDEAASLGLGTQAHLAQTGVARMDALDAARLGLGSLEHWYGLPESLFADRTVQDYPLDYNYNDEYHRFAHAGRLWQQAARPHTDKWNAVMDELVALGFVLSPTMTIYEANRDVMRAREAEWHDTYTLPSLWQFYQPSRTSHALTAPTGRKPEFGIIRVGNLADLVIVPENPLHNLKVLYGTGTVRLDESGAPVKVGGVKYTIKDGIVYDAQRLLEDVARLVEAAKRATVSTESGGA